MATPRKTAKGEILRDADFLKKATKYLHELSEKPIGDAMTAVSSYDELTKWWKTETGCGAPKRPTGENWLRLLKNNEWRNAMHDYVSNASGHKAWTLALALKMQKHQFSEVWLIRVEEANTFFGKVFAEKSKDLVNETDLLLINGLPFPRNAKHLQHWFFPKEEGYYLENPPHRAFAWANLKLSEPFAKRTKMEHVWKFKGQSHLYRRENFLKGLSNRDYCRVYENLASEDGDGLRVWTWESLKHQVDVVTVIADSVLHHVLLWYDPMYEPAKVKKVKKAKRDDEVEEAEENEASVWIEKLTHKFFPLEEVEEPTTNEGPATTEELRIDEDPFVDDEPEDEEIPAEEAAEQSSQAAIDFIDHVLFLLTKDFDSWSSSSFKDQLPFESFAGYDILTGTKRESHERLYLQRFDRPEWRSLLDLCQISIPQEFQRMMKDTTGSREQDRASKPWVKWDSFSEYASKDGWWKEEDTEPLSSNGVQLSFEQYVEINGAKYKYVQIKGQLRAAAREPVDKGKELVARLRQELGQCAKFLGDHGFKVDPEDLEEDLADFILGVGQAKSSDEKTEGASAGDGNGDQVMGQAGESPKKRKLGHSRSDNKPI